MSSAQVFSGKLSHVWSTKERLDQDGPGQLGSGKVRLENLKQSGQVRIGYIRAGQGLESQV